MSFFKELKEDLAQAVDELVPEEENETTGEEESLDEFDLDGETSGNVDEQMLSDLSAEEELEKEESVPSASDVSSETLSTPVFDSDAEAKSDVTVITKGTTINGSITSDGSLEVMGTITGDIECLGKLTIIGNVKGNSTASEVYVNTSRLDGSIISKGSVKIGVGTVVVGDITASSSVIAGAVKGQIDVNGPVIVDSTAVIKGNINAKAVQINNGAVLEGYCSLSYSTVDIDTFFDEENN
ncbi:MAG: polymer-forming cytoskeletal protein [Lachnospiraceae bacterium]|nr:polymer-forming cytoskeletal protein [Lachnospiraceae bacterium]